MTRAERLAALLEELVADGRLHDDEAEAAVNRVMVQRAKRAVVAADGHKLGRVGFARICEVTDVAAADRQGRRRGPWRPSAGRPTRSSWRDVKHR
jgi:polyhydroxyalkanoate synthesis regulator phasin